jgi:hypothetical protein
MRLTAENTLLLVARKKGYVSNINQKLFKSTHFFVIMREFVEDDIVRRIPSKNLSDRRYALTEYGELIAAGLCMLNSCPIELKGRYKWDLIKES